MLQLDPHTAPIAKGQIASDKSVTVNTAHKTQMLTSSLPLYHSPCTIQQSVAGHQIQRMYGNPTTRKRLRLRACLCSSEFQLM
jgi:hypothetical protein